MELYQITVHTSAALAQPEIQGGPNLFAYIHHARWDQYFEGNYAPYYLRRELLQPEWMLPAEWGFLRQALSDCLSPGQSDGVSERSLKDLIENDGQ